MGIRTSDPLQARWCFRLREAENWLIVVIGFLVLNLGLWVFFHGFLASLIAIVVMFCLYFFVLDKRTIGIECPHCHKYIETDTPWRCGFCGRVNFQTDDAPFVGRCGNRQCGAKPKAYQCHHCGELIFFTNDRQKINYAMCVNIPLPKKQQPVQTDSHVTDVSKQKKDIEITRLKVDKAKLDVELKSYTEILEPPKPRTQKEAVEESFANFEDRNMTGAEIVRRKKVEAAEKYKDNPPELERQNKLIDQWARDHLDIM